MFEKKVGGQGLERRIYFVVGDLLACIFAGAAGGWLAHGAVPGDLSSLFGMFIGMFLGMIGGMITGLVLSPFFGAMEIMLPAAQAGMVGGMIVAMQHTMGGIDPEDAVRSGAAAGVACLAFTYFLQTRLYGEASPDG